MMRIFMALACAVGLAACSSGDGGAGGHGGGVDASVTPATCGDGVCVATEINSCPSDCGTPGMTAAVCGNGVCETTKGESAATCAQDCGGGGGGSGSGSGSGSGGGGSGSGGSLNCADQNVVLACVVCLIDATQCVGVDPVGCAACLGGGAGSGSGSGAGTCNFNGVCDPGEDATSCPTDCP